MLESIIILTVTYQIVGKAINSSVIHSTTTAVIKH